MRLFELSIMEATITTDIYNKTLHDIHRWLTRMQHSFMEILFAKIVRDPPLSSKTPSFLLPEEIRPSVCASCGPFQLMRLGIIIPRLPAEVFVGTDQCIC